MLNSTTSWSLDQQDERLNVIKSYNIDDKDVVDLISKLSRSYRWTEPKLNDLLKKKG